MLILVCLEESWQLTFGQNLPFAGLVSRRVGQNIVEILKQVLHLTPSFSLRHFVAYAKFWRTAVIPATTSHTVGVTTLQAGNAGMLHGVVMSGGYV
jgi:hypothetical protein